MHASIGQMFLDRSRYFLSTEYRTKLRLAVEAMTSNTVWWRANDQSNSAGNLLLHLDGNIRQWIVSGVGGAPDSRHRSTEFAAQSGATGAELLAALDRTLEEVDRVLATLTPYSLLERRTIQGREVSVLDAIFHVVEHFSTHLGQIVLIAKMRAPGTINFYDDDSGLATPVWEAKIGRR
jgi:uncharacterized damage-inducible protein DinB